MPKRYCAALILCLPLASCDSGTSAPSPQTSEATPTEGIPVTTTGTFVCRNGAPGSGFQIPATKDVPPGGDAVLTVSAPKSSSATSNPPGASLHCQVDVDWCSGSSCRKYPLIDFVGKDGQGMTWKQISTDGQAKSATFTAKVHNGDTEPHTIRLALELPTSWKPSPEDTSGQ
jgi:hypothetical protein